jgi:hypothetical protein
MSPEQEAEESEQRFAAYVAQLASVMGHADRERPLGGLLYGSAHAAGAQERGTAGGTEAAWSCGRATPIAAALCGSGAVVG